MNSKGAPEDRLASKEIVLLGVGHTNAHVVRKWAMAPIADTRLTCVSNFHVATYSGMLPAVLAGQASVDEMQIDLVRLCASVGARLIVDRVIGLDTDASLVLFEDRPPIRFDVLSVGVGSVPDDRGVAVRDDALLRIKPMQTFLTRFKQRVEESIAEKQGQDRPIRIVVVGGGVAGVEVLLCLPPFLQRWREQSFELELVSRGSSLLSELSESTQARVQRILAQRGVAVRLDSEVSGVESGTVTYGSGERAAADIVIWATGARAPDLLGQLNLPVDQRGFLATDPFLRVQHDAPPASQASSAVVFAVGDSGSIQRGRAIAKAGVYAVRQGPVLWENVRRSLESKPLKRFQPQRSFLRLINTGDGGAIGQWKGISFAGQWVWKLKDKIDRDFMEKFQPTGGMSDEGGDMQCDGCGCKLGPDVLNKALDQSWGDADQVAAAEEGRPGQHCGVTLDDAVLLEGSQAKLYASTDFFTNPLDDAYEFGRLAALHAASDLTATGVGVRQAFSNVVLPKGDSRAQQTLFADFTAGARREFEGIGAKICGGHTIVGPRFEAGFTVVGERIGDEPLTKAGLQPGDQLYLTKPLGIGVLLAALMRAECRAMDYSELKTVLFSEQSSLILAAIEVGCRAATDVTGFGLAGHLLEMLEASRCSAQLELNSVPILSGAIEAVQAGIESSLAPANKSVRNRIQLGVDLDPSRIALLFDPQTSGGFLVAIPGQRVTEWEKRVQESGEFLPSRIGEVFLAGKAAGGEPLLIR
ncbi:MAG: selenide, water dikinase SelD [Aureliella sp.]